MPLPSTREPRWWSWADIVRHTDRLGIPNFQRGAVWDTSNRVALLESIYQQSPCGSFVLWAPESDEGDPQRHGVPLRAFGPDKEPMWLVDGQQRTRAMLDTFEQLVGGQRRHGGLHLVREADMAGLRSVGGEAGEHASESSDEPLESDDDGEGDVHVWLVVLPAMTVFDQDGLSLFGRHSESRNVIRGSMFRLLRPRARTRLGSQGQLRPVPPLPVGTVPLATLLAPGGLFHDLELRAAALAAVETFSTDTPDLRLLDELLPWGPNFVTGHAFELPSSGRDPATPMRWAHLHERRGDEKIAEQVSNLSKLLKDQWAPVFDGFAGMLHGNRFAVGWLPPSDVSAAIDAYVRINRSGIRVRAEERALALLSRAWPGLLDDLADFTSRRDDEGPVDDPRALLAHESDRQMGFSVWMTAVTRYTALALLGDSARRWLGTSAIDRGTFGYRLDRVGPNETEAGYRTWAREDFESPGQLVHECAKRATAALLLLDDILSNELHLDHRMARTSPASLQPMIDLFYRVPAEDLGRLRDNGSFRGAVGRILHWTLLSPYIDKADMEFLVSQTHGVDEAQANKASAPLRPWTGEGETGTETLHAEIRAALRRHVAALGAIWKRKGEGTGSGPERTPLSMRGGGPQGVLTRLSIHDFTAEVRDARSLQHRMVGWLYAIERRRGAQEFSWVAQVEGHRVDPSTGVPLPSGELRPAAPLRAARGAEASALYPEKQHVVPFSIARRVVGKGGTRSTASPANAIGNLTWLSRRQNGLDALSDRWTVMDPARDRANLLSRGLLAPTTFDGQATTVLAVYEELRADLLAGPERSEANDARARGLLEAFCDGRRAWMVEQMRSWLSEPLAADEQWWLGG